MDRNAVCVALQNRSSGVTAQGPSLDCSPDSGSLRSAEAQLYRWISSRPRRVISEEPCPKSSFECELALYAEEQSGCVFFVKECLAVSGALGDRWASKVMERGPGEPLPPKAEKYQTLK